MRKEDISYDKDDLKVIVDDKKLDINVLEYIEVKEKYDFYLRCIKYFNNFIFINIGDVKKSSFFSFSTIMKCYKNTFNLKNWTYQGFFLRKCINFACC